MKRRVQLKRFLSGWGLVESSCPGDDLDEFPGDDSLPGPVEGEGELVDHLARVLGGVVHGGHAGGLLGAGALLQRVEQHGREGELHVGLDHVRVQGVVHRQLRCALRNTLYTFLINISAMSIQTASFSCSM